MAGSLERLLTYAQDARRAGVAAGLVRLAEPWGRALGLTELASDAQLEDHDSHAFHRSVRFREVERSVCYAKRIGGPEG